MFKSLKLLDIHRVLPIESLLLGQPCVYANTLELYCPIRVAHLTQES